MNTNEDKSKEINTDIPTEIDEVTQDRFITGHEYDGIKELDNKLPPWWVYLFYITIVFSLVYVIRYHFINKTPLQAEEYAIEMAEAAEKYKIEEASIINASTIQFMKDETSLADGKSTFDKICSVCHGMKGEGLVGPNFTDKYWIHGGSISDMYNIVISGVIEKGMISYKDQLSPILIQNVLSYIISLQGTDPPNQKAQEGELFEGTY